MNSIRVLFFGLAMVVIAGCAAPSVREEYGGADGKQIVAREYYGGDANYAQYLAAQSQPDAQPAVTGTCSDDRCTENVAAFAAITTLAKQLGGGNRIAPPPQKRTWGDRLESITKASIGALPGLGGIYAGIEGSKQSRRERETLYGTFGGIVSDVATLGATPTYQAGGDIITGTRTETNISDSYNDSSDHSQHGDTITDSYNTPTTVTGDGNAVGEGNIANNGDWRSGSDGPFDDHSNDGDECTGADCQSLPVDPVEPPQ